MYAKDQKGKFVPRLLLMIVDEMAIQVLFLGNICYYHDHSYIVSDVTEMFITNHDLLARNK